MPGLFFLYFGLFNAVESKQMFNTNIADDWNQTAVLWCQKQLLCQLIYNHCPICLSIKSIERISIATSGLLFAYFYHLQMQHNVLSKLMSKVIPARIRHQDLNSRPLVHVSILKTARIV